MATTFYPVESLVMQTRKKTSINNNLVRTEPGEPDRLRSKKCLKDFPNADHRDIVPCLSYNCHGLTFASRRAAIIKSADVQQIIEEDGYVSVLAKDVRAGDIVIYKSGEESGFEIEHSGIVLFVNKTVIVPLVQVLSKWGYAHEVIHPVGYVPYASNFEYYRMMPNKFFIESVTIC